MLEVAALIAIDCRTGPAAALAAKLTLLCDAPFTVTVWLAGLNVSPFLLGTIV